MVGQGRAPGAGARRAADKGAVMAWIGTAMDAAVSRRAARRRIVRRPRPCGSWLAKSEADLMQRLEPLSGSAFDRELIDAQVKDHSDDIKRFDKEEAATVLPGQARKVERRWPPGNLTRLTAERVRQHLTWPALRAGSLMSILILLLAAEQARAQDAVELCREKGTDDDVRPIPQSLVPAAKRVFGLRMPDQQVLHSTVFRCADRRVLLCTYGANLPCGKANSDRDLPGPRLGAATIRTPTSCRDLQSRAVIFTIGAVSAAGPRSSPKSKRSIRAVLLPATGNGRTDRYLSGASRASNPLLSVRVLQLRQFVKLQSKTLILCPCAWGP